MRIRRRTKKKIIWSALLLILAIFASERLYNNQAKFKTSAESVEHYRILDAGFTNTEKLADFDYLYNLLEEYYPYFVVNERSNDIDWFANKNIYKRILKNTKNDAEYYVALDKILGDLNDSDTYVLDGEMYRRFLKHYYPDKATILTNVRTMGRYHLYEGLSGIKLDPNNDFIFHNGPVLDTKKLIENELAYMKIESMSDYHLEEDYPKIREFLIEVEDYDKLIIDIRGNSGWADEYWMNIVGLLIDEVHSAEYYSFFKENPRTSTEVFKLENITVIRDLEREILDRFPPEIETYLNFYKVNTIEIEARTEVNFQGKVYLLVDEEVRSSAEKFAAFSKDTGFATLVGDKTGGGMIFDEVPMYNLPYGGFLVRYSREMAMNSDGTINMEEKTSPHIMVNDTSYSEDFTEDKCVQAVIEN